jgi:hypothetical protein
MKFIGRGWQYSVYDLENGRVFKTRNLRIVAYWYMFCSGELRVWKFPRYYKSADSNIRDSFRKIKETHLDMKLFGNPNILENGLDYEQDYIESIANYLHRVSFEEGKEIVDRFIKCAKFFVGHRLMDKSFNMGTNFGICPNGEIALIDIGELYSKPENIQKQIDMRIWQEPYILRPIPEKIRPYFFEQMEKHFIKHEK